MNKEGVTFTHIMHILTIIALAWCGYIFYGLQSLKDDIANNRYLWDYVKNNQQNANLQAKDIYQIVEQMKWQDKRYDSLSSRIMEFNRTINDFSSKCCSVVRPTLLAPPLEGILDGNQNGNQ